MDFAINYQNIKCYHKCYPRKAIIKAYINQQFLTVLVILHCHKEVTDNLNLNRQLLIKFVSTR